LVLERERLHETPPPSASATDLTVSQIAVADDGAVFVLGSRSGHDEMLHRLTGDGTLVHSFAREEVEARIATPSTMGR
jgi:hypothetical protein